MSSCRLFRCDSCLTAWSLALLQPWRTSWSSGWFQLNLLVASAFVLWSGYLGRMRTPKAYHNAYSSRAQYGKAASVFVFDSTSSFVFDSCLWIRCSLNLILCLLLSFFLWRSYLLSTSILIWIQEIGFDWFWLLDDFAFLLKNKNAILT